MPVVVAHGVELVGMSECGHFCKTNYFRRDGSYQKGQLWRRWMAFHGEYVLAANANHGYNYQSSIILSL